jgi:hypothetical protein
VFHKTCELFERRSSKIVTTVVSTFTANYIHLWPTFFPDKPLSPPLPSFDGRAVLYPGVQNLRDYLSWRQVDCELSLPSPTKSFVLLPSDERRSYQQLVQHHFLGLDTARWYERGRSNRPSPCRHPSPHSCRFFA